MAPEVIEGKYGREVDAWSIGVILYMILTGNPPFNGSNHQEIFEAVKIGKISFQNPQLIITSDSVKDLIAKLLVKNPSHRFGAKEAYNHPWVAEEVERESSKAQLEDSVLVHLKKFSVSGK